MVGVQSTASCEHVALTREVRPRSNGCEQCLALGDAWVELRLCMTCGQVGCCDSSNHKHATAHFRETGHPISTAFDTGGDWGWCYVDELLLQPYSVLHADATG
jgi:uncharacterized UBP type Zn finger protein